MTVSSDGLLTQIALSARQRVNPAPDLDFLSLTLLMKKKIALFQQPAKVP